VYPPAPIKEGGRPEGGGGGGGAGGPEELNKEKTYILNFLFRLINPTYLQLRAKVKLSSKYGFCFLLNISVSCFTCLIKKDYLEDGTEK